MDSVKRKVIDGGSFLIFNFDFLILKNDKN